MDSELQLLSDGDGLAVIGPSTAVDRFIREQGLDQVPAKALELTRVKSILSTGGAVAKIGSQVAENSGRWVKLTAESAKAVKQFGLMPTKTPGVSHAMIGKPGEVKQWLQIAGSPTALLSGPLALAALSTMMQQRAMQQQMEEIVEYLAEISEKVDDILRSQKDAVLAGMIGVDLIIEEALTIRDQVGRVSEVTWSKVQATSLKIASTQAYVLLQLDAIAEKLAKKADLGGFAEAAREADPIIREWLAVLARCVRLQDGISVLELDRVLDASPLDLDQHRLGLIVARQNRLEVIARSTARLLEQMNQTAQRANTKVLLNPRDAPAAVRSSNLVATVVLDFRGRLGLESDHLTLEAKRWSQAATEVRDKMITVGAEGLGVVRRAGVEIVDQAADIFRPVDTDGDGIPDKSRVVSAAEGAGSAIKDAATGTAAAISSGLSKVGAATKGFATGAVGAAGARLKRAPNPIPPEPD
ncbi:MAG: hypothetical protein LBE83_05175 [Propionibacteriaceae bacterium]|jgi:hypothetical protein|nr:hypothetical protein [Propionibacteriaceae bacterium]